MYLRVAIDKMGVFFLTVNTLVDHQRSDQFRGWSVFNQYESIQPNAIYQLRTTYVLRNLSLLFLRYKCQTKHACGDQS